MNEFGKITQAKWEVFSGTVQGESHKRKGIVNQDSVKTESSSGESGWVIAAVADGHGSPRSFRSDRGAQFAVDVAVETLREFADKPDLDQLTATHEDGATLLTPLDHIQVDIVQKWRDQVNIHLKSSPITSNEWGNLQKETGELVRQKLESSVESNDEQWYVIYGSTVLVTLVTSKFALYLQLGDGEILVVPANSANAVSPILADQELIANETTSLCMKNASHEFRSQFQVLASDLPRLILLTTDGYSNSFSSRAGFVQVGADLLRMIQERGIEAVNGSLKDWLSETSQQGSGDDITVAIIYREQASPLQVMSDASQEQVTNPPIVSKCPTV